MKIRPKNELRSSTQKVEGIVFTMANGMHLGSAFLTGACTNLYLSHYGVSSLTSVAIATLIGGMTFGALNTFTTAAIHIMPKLTGVRRKVSGLLTATALAGTLAISGTSNATFLAYEESRSLQREAVLQKAEAAFSDAQSTLRQLEQIRPILSAGRTSAGTLKTYEEKRGQTGSGRGPIFMELVVQETRLKSAEKAIGDVAMDAESKIRTAQKILSTARIVLKGEDKSAAETERALENALTRLSALVIELRQSLPIASLKAIAEMLRAPVKSGALSDNEAIRKTQEAIFERLHREFAPIGSALQQAIIDLEDRLPKDVPAYKRMSPTATVFAHADDLAWVLALGYALDIIPYLAIALIMLAHSQSNDTPPSRGPGYSSRRRNRSRRRNGS